MKINIYNITGKTFFFLSDKIRHRMIKRDIFSRDSGSYDRIYYLYDLTITIYFIAPNAQLLFILGTTRR